MRSGFFTIGILISAGAVIGGNYLIEKWDELDLGFPKSITNTFKEEPQPAQPTTVYKWRDSSGNWQFGDKPPSEGAYEISEISGVQTMKMVTPKLPLPEEKPKADPAPTANISPLTPFTDPQKVKEVIDQARNIQTIQEERLKQIP